MGLALSIGASDGADILRWDGKWATTRSDAQQLEANPHRVRPLVRHRHDTRRLVRSEPAAGRDVRICRRRSADGAEHRLVTFRYHMVRAERLRRSVHHDDWGDVDDDDCESEWDQEHSSNLSEVGADVWNRPRVPTLLPSDDPRSHTTAHYGHAHGLGVRLAGTRLR